MASDSDIKPNVTCSVSDVFSLFQAFKSHLPQALLFLKHIREVEVLALTSDSNEPQVGLHSCDSGRPHAVNYIL